MKNLFILFCISITFSNSLQAQSNFIPGYIITLKGDTLTGWIKNQSRAINCQKVIFKEEKNGSEMIYDASGIKGYNSKKGEIYVSLDFKYRKINTTADKMLEESQDNIKDKNPEYVQGNFFLISLIHGTAELYEYTDIAAHPHYFICKNGGPLQELYQVRKYYHYVLGGWEKRGYRWEKNYIGQLKILFNDCPLIIPEVDYTEFTEKALIKITSEYNKYQSTPNPDKHSNKKINDIRIEKSVELGINLSQYYFLSSSSIYNYLTRSPHPYMPHIIAGFFFNLYDRNLSEKLSMKLGILYYQIRYEYQYMEFPIPTLKNIYQVQFNNQHLKFPIIINYDLTAGKIRPYLYLGTPFNVLLRSVNRLTLTRVSSTGSTTESRDALAPPSSPGNQRFTNNFELFGYLAGGGIKKINDAGNGYFFDIRYERNPSITRMYSLKSKSVNFFISLGYIF